MTPALKLVSSTEGVLRMPRGALGADGQASIRDLLRGRLAVQFPSVFSAAQCATWTRAVYAAREHWSSNFGDVQFTLGRAWYTHLEEDREDEYFARASESDAIVEAALPGMRSMMLDLVGQLTCGGARQRAEWCGPGVHVFPAGGLCARVGGDVHFDTEGLDDAHVAAREPAFTLVVMLQPPESGGELRVWDQLFAGDDHAAPQSGTRWENAPFRAGDLTVINAYRMHQIQPFRGPLDRVSITAHVARSGDEWEVWF